MLRSAGFEIVERPEAEVFICRRIEIDDKERENTEQTEITEKTEEKSQ
jgi:hypothetical protein